MSLPKSFIAAAFMLAASPYSQLLADDAPPTIPGNPGVPGLLAEIAELEQELAVTEAELEDTETELTATQGELMSTQTSLAETQSDLQLTQGELYVTSALLDESLEALEREQNRYRVPQTGQVDCWGAFNQNPDSPHVTIPCPNTGQDGRYKAGLAPPFVRFTDNGDGTVTDRFTELVWLKNAGCLNDYSWDQAVQFGKLLHGTAGICELNDQSPTGAWRLPNVRELLSLLDFKTAGYFSVDAQALPDGHPFDDLSGWYWTSTTYALPTTYPVDSFIFPCGGSLQYGSDNRPRFNDAYVVNVTVGEVIHTPKEDRDTISKVQRCFEPGFSFGSAPPGLPKPRVIAVRDQAE